MKKVLILGSDFGTYDLAVEAKKMGLYVIATDLMETSPTKEAADEAWHISTTDLDLLEKKIIEENISGILTGASEFNIEMCRALCKKLNLPLYCEKDSAWAIARDKSKFKALCKECGVPVAQDYYISDALTREELDAVKYPVVVKPVDKSGNRGMSYCANEEELVKGYKYARSISDNENIVVERQLNGPEYTAYFLVADGEVELSYYTSAHHQPGTPHNLYTLEYITACHLKQFLEEVNESIKNVFKKAGCTNGVAWIECMYDQDGHFYVLEMGYRLAGPVLYVMHEKISGFNTIRWMIECALGVKHTKKDLPTKLPVYKECVASYDLFTCCEGVIETIEGLEEVKALPNVVIDIPKREGGSVRYHANMGVIRIYGKNFENMRNTVEKINSTLFIKNAQGENMFIKYDDFEGIRIEYEEGLREFGLM